MHAGDKFFFLFVGGQGDDVRFFPFLRIETNQMEKFTNDELVNYLFQSEWDDRQYRTLQRGIKNANFRYKAIIEQLDYAEERGLDKNVVQRLSDGTFISKGEDLILPAARAPVM
jgi:DNA replication protein DnaC